MPRPIFQAQFWLAWIIYSLYQGNLMEGFPLFCVGVTDAGCPASLNIISHIVPPSPGAPVQWNDLLTFTATPQLLLSQIHQSLLKALWTGWSWKGGTLVGLVFFIPWFIKPLINNVFITKNTEEPLGIFQGGSVWGALLMFCDIVYNLPLSPAKVSTTNKNSFCSTYILNFL